MYHLTYRPIWILEGVIEGLRDNTSKRHLASEEMIVNNQRLTVQSQS